MILLNLDIDSIIVDSSFLIRFNIYYKIYSRDAPAA